MPLSNSSEFTVQYNGHEYRVEADYMQGEGCEWAPHTITWIDDMEPEPEMEQFCMDLLEGSDFLDAFARTIAEDKQAHLENLADARREERYLDSIDNSNA